MIYILIPIIILVFIVYLLFCMLRKKYRDKIFVSLGYETAQFDSECIGLNKTDIEDFLDFPVNIKRLHKKQNDCYRIYFSDTTIIRARGMYSGPSQKTYVFINLKNKIVPDFTLRIRKFLETSFETKDYIKIDSCGKALVRGKEDAVRFLSEDYPLLVSLINHRNDIVVCGAKSQIVIWSTKGYVDNFDIRQFVKTIESHLN